jgi:hypothetical protein
MIRRLLVLAVAALASACASIPLGTIVKLATWNPAETDPAEIRAAVRLPDSLGVAAGSPALTLSAWREDDDRIEDRIVLAEVTDPADTATLDRWRKSGFAIHAYRIPAVGVPQVASFRERAEAEKLNHFSLQIGVKGCRHGGFNGLLLVSTFLKTDAGADYVMLTREIDIATLPETKGAGTPLPPCDQPAPVAAAD